MIFTLDCSTMLPYILYVLKNVKNEKERNDIFGYLVNKLIEKLEIKFVENGGMREQMTKARKDYRGY